MPEPKKKYKITKKSSNISHISKETGHKYTKYFPSILDPNFSSQIESHGLFKKYKSIINQERLENLYKAFETNIRPDEDTTKQSSNIFLHKTITKMLRNFISPYSPYRNLLIYHEMGVGKTCTAITIAESLKEIVRNSNTKIYVIRPDEFARQLFRKDVIADGKPLNQCTGDTYIQNPKNKELAVECANKNEEACESMKLRVDKEIRTFYKFSGFKMWARDVSKEIDAKTKNIESPEDKERKTIEVIQKMFNNAVIIVDEAHELRDNNEKEAKIVTPVLNMVLENASNVRLIFLTATPIYDKPQNIISLINYFLLNDKRSLIKENDVFDKFGNLKETGRKLLIEKTRGYISFMRGNNPYEFPIRLSARFNIPKEIFDLNNYPKKDYQGRQLEPNNNIKYLELLDCNIRGKQLELFNYHIKNDKLIDIDEELLDKISVSVLLEESKSSIEKVSSKDILVSDDTGEVFKNELEDELEDDSISYDEVISLEEKIFQKKKPDGTFISPNRKSEKLKISTVAYQFESQMSNIIYQSLDECNGNLKLAVGDMGLNQIVSKQAGKWTYEFNDIKYAKRFKLPELFNWSAKIAKVVELAIKSSETGKGPIFIYTNFVNAGAKPIAMALEMNGFRRYKMHDSPLVESSEKSSMYRGDYILYTGDASLSSYAREYINKAQKMVNEKSVKVFVGTSVASEGLNLFGYREVHIIDPWHNINLTEQSIGRVIRTGSHLHLPPQERNVCVYQYASTIGERESYDLKIYKICENKAVKAGTVEKLLKENAIDCMLNKETNVYDTSRYDKKIPQITSHGKKISISLADVPFSRNCFYMKECELECQTSMKTPAENNYSNFPIMQFNYDNELKEYKNLIINLVKTSFNINIDYLRNYLKKLIYGTDEKKIKTAKYKITKRGTQKQGTQKQNVYDEDTMEWHDEDTFQGAIQEIINTDIPVIDKFNRQGKIVLSGNTLRFIPNEQLAPNMSIIKQYLPPPNNPPIKSQVDLKAFITTLSDEQKRLMEDADVNYDEVLSKTIEKVEQIFYGVYQKEYKFNIKVKMEEVLDLFYNKLNYSFKVAILKNLLEKIVRGIKLNDNEKKIEPAIRNNIVYLTEVFHNIKQDKDAKKSIYGFIIQNDARLELYILDDDKKFQKNQGNLKKIIEYRKNAMKLQPNNKLFGFLKYEKGYDAPLFKITDTATKGEKKSVRGTTCLTKSTTDIKKNLNKLDDKILKGKYVSTNKNALCNDIELIMKRNDINKIDGKKWYYTPEEYEIYFGDL
jgi:hypothetical protein